MRTGTSLVRVSRISRKSTGRAAVDLASLHEYLGLVPVGGVGALFVWLGMSCGGVGDEMVETGDDAEAQME